MYVVCVSSLGVCEAFGDNLDCNRFNMNKVELNWRSVDLFRLLIISYPPAVKGAHTPFEQLTPLKEDGVYLGWNKVRA